MKLETQRNAAVLTFFNRDKILFSYGTPVAVYFDNNKTLFIQEGRLSKTTRTHVNRLHAALDHCAWAPRDQTFFARALVTVAPRSE